MTDACGVSTAMGRLRRRASLVPTGPVLALRPAASGRARSGRCATARERVLQGVAS
jgi:hypothetical protein